MPEVAYISGILLNSCSLSSSASRLSIGWGDCPWLPSLNPFVRLICSTIGNVCFVLFFFSLGSLDLNAFVCVNPNQSTFLFEKVAVISLLVTASCTEKNRQVTYYSVYYLNTHSST